MLRVIPPAPPEDEQEDEQEETVIDALSAHVDKAWQKAFRAKEAVNKRLAKALRQYRSRYEPDKLESIRALKGSTVYLPLTNIKCRAAESWLREILSVPEKDLFTIKPTPIPELPKETVDEIKAKLAYAGQTLAGMLIQGQTDPFVLKESLNDLRKYLEKKYKDKLMEEAKEAAEEAAELIQDQFEEGGFYDALDKILHDISIYPAAIIKGPVYEKERKLRRNIDPPKTVVEWVVKEKYYRVSPFNIFPAPESTGIDDGDLIEISSITLKDLYSYIGMEGFNEEKVRKVIEEYENGGFKNALYRSQTEESLNNEDSSLESEKIDILIYWGSVRGSLLLEWGMTPDQIGDPHKYYDVCAWKVGNHVIKAMLNPDPLGKKPYSKASFIEVPGSWWGISIPELLEHIQNAANAAARAIVNNTGISSMPIVERNVDRVSQYESPVLYPGMVLDATEAQMTSAPAYRFYQAPINSDKMILVLREFLKMADELSGIPAYSHGDVTVGGAGRCLTEDSTVITPDGTCRIKDIKEGDLVATVDGSFTEVTGVYPQEGEEDIYRVSFSDGSFVDCTEDHLWVVLDSKERQSVRTTEELMRDFRRKVERGKNAGKSILKWHLPSVGAVQFPYRGVKVDPYTMGIYIGDGSLHRGYVRLSLNRTEMPFILGRIPYATNKPITDSRGSNCFSVGIPVVGQFICQYGLDGLKAPEKFIPDDYLFNSIEVRMEVLRGLIDSDGYISKSGSVVFTTTSRQLIEDIRFLVKSLGGRVWKVTEIEGGERHFGNKRFYKCRKSYKIHLNVPFDVVSYIPSKQSRYKKFPIKNVFIEDIAPLHEKKNVVCIKVEHESSIFLCNELIPTHNTASGLTMLTANSSRGIKSVIRNIDKGIIEDMVRRQYNLNFEMGIFNGDIPDCKVTAKGSRSLQEREAQSVRSIELLQALSNPIDFQILGPEGRKYLLKEIIEARGFDTEKILGNNNPPFPAPAGGFGPPAPTNKSDHLLEKGEDVNEFKKDNG